MRTATRGKSGVTYHGAGEFKNADAGIGNDLTTIVGLCAHSVDIPYLCIGVVVAECKSSSRKGIGRVGVYKASTTRVIISRYSKISASRLDREINRNGNAARQGKRRTVNRDRSDGDFMNHMPVVVVDDSLIGEDELQSGEQWRFDLRVHNSWRGNGNSMSCIQRRHPDFVV